MNKPDAVQQLQSISSGLPITAPPRLVRAAHEFEAAMMKELLSPLHNEDSDDRTSSSSALTDFAGGALGQAISEHGGFGIAEGIIRQLTSQGNHSGKTPVPNFPNAKRIISEPE